MTTQTGKNRRRRRSDDLMTALHYQLEQVREDYGFDNIVLASEDGLTVAHSGNVWRAYLLAAFSAEFAGGSSDKPIEEVFAPYLQSREGSQVNLESFTSSVGHPVHLCAVSPMKSDRAEEGIRHARQGLIRIMGQAA